SAWPPPPWPSHRATETTASAPPPTRLRAKPRTGLTRTRTSRGRAAYPRPQRTGAPEKGRPFCMSAEGRSLLAVEVGVGLVLEEEHVHHQRHRDARRHIRDEERHGIVCLERLVDRRRGAAEHRVRQRIAHPDAQRPNMRGE